ncbi:WecB/TagA/CpsF family glycosyltransferase [Paraclostridium bifermentans]|uniref:WecB/TagA/CpsF family glycosyltransferase n=1 Tax=Paraclostridium bifermentans TaxID=1490 RepID=UPI0011DD1CE8|nr:WecB/TagA/CpsF family glycosyltransferase [Paraclostridium bifermentans]
MNFFGINLYLNRMDELINIIFENIDNKDKTAYYAINPDCMLIAEKDNDYYDILKNKRNKVYVDGKWIIYTQKFLNLPYAKERISTTDLFPRILELADIKKKEIRIFLLGGSENTAKNVIENMSENYKFSKFVGEHHGYFNKDNSASIIEYINYCKPDILFVGFGCPIQEKWVNSNFDEINASSIITCGGLFDYYSNNVKRAPKWMQNIGMEWFFRFLQEPNRLYKRYIIGNFRYIYKLIYLKLRGMEYYENKYIYRK